MDDKLALLENNIMICLIDINKRLRVLEKANDKKTKPSKEV